MIQSRSPVPCKLSVSNARKVSAVASARPRICLARLELPSANSEQIELACAWNLESLALRTSGVRWTRATGVKRGGEGKRTTGERTYSRNPSRESRPDKRGKLTDGRGLGVRRRMFAETGSERHGREGEGEKSRR